jgi:hypothetical protein
MLKSIETAFLPLMATPCSVIHFATPVPRPPLYDCRPNTGHVVISVRCCDTAIGRAIKTASSKTGSTSRCLCCRKSENGIHGGVPDRGTWLRHRSPWGR